MTLYTTITTGGSSPAKTPIGTRPDRYSVLLSPDLLSIYLYA